MSIKIFLLTLLLLLNYSQVNSHGNGAPTSRCDTMEPGHWVSPQEILSPYQIIIDKTVISPGDRVNITLRTIRGQTGFKGFFVMVKEADDDSQTPKENEVYGAFDLMNSDIKHAQPVHCFNRRNSAMTHLMNDVKSSVELSWIAPKLLSEESTKRNSNPYMDKELKVVATFVKDFWTVWTNIEPVGGLRMLLTDTQQLSPKFPQPQQTGNTFRGDHPHHQHPSSSEEKQGISGENMPLEESSSWTHFKRAWNFMVGMFGSSQSASSQQTSFS